MDRDVDRCRVVGGRPQHHRGLLGDLPSFDICPCCGVTAGYEHVQPSAARQFRERWLTSGAPWAAIGATRWVGAGRSAWSRAREV